MNPLKVSKLLADEYNVKILAATFKDSKSAQELSLKFDIPIAACYRRIRELEMTGLILCSDRILSQKGKRVKLYRSQVKGVYLFYESGKFRVRLDLTSMPGTDIDETWYALDYPPAEN